MVDTAASSHVRALDMKRDWNARARRNAAYFIATSEEAGDEAFRASGERDVRAFFDGLDEVLGPERHALDVGCGIGRMDEFVAPRVGSLTGLDVSGEMVAKARERLAAVPNARFVEGDGFTLAPIGDASIDLAFSHIVFQHVPRPVVLGYFREVRRVLRAGGDFVFQVPEWNPRAPADPPHHDTFEMRFWTEGDLRDALLPLGFGWVGARRFPVRTPELDFDALRVHVRLAAAPLGLTEWV